MIPEFNKKMDQHKSNFGERLRKAQERSQRVKAMFAPYATMFKVESRPYPDIVGDIEARQLQCVNCKSLLEWRIYTLAPDKFDQECPDCGVKAHDFYRGKLHKELDADA